MLCYIICRLFYSVLFYADDRDCLKWVLVFWGLEFWFDCIMEVEELGYNRGFSVIHFVLMYMIARCIKLYENDIKKIRPMIWVLGYLFLTLVIIVSHIIGAGIILTQLLCFLQLVVFCHSFIRRIITK